MSPSRFQRLPHPHQRGVTPSPPPRKSTEGPQEGSDLHHEMIKGSVITIDKKIDFCEGNKAALVHDQINEPP